MGFNPNRSTYCKFIRFTADASVSSVVKRQANRSAVPKPEKMVGI